MSETYHPYIESDAEKDDDDTDKKDKKKRAERSGGLLATQAVEQAPAERPLKLGSELLRPLSIEVAKPETELKSKARESDEPEHSDKTPGHAEEVSVRPVGEQALPEGDLQQLQAELAALNPEAEDDDEDADKPKQVVKTSESKTEADATEAEPKEPTQKEAAFQAIANAPELADLAHLKLPEAEDTPSAVAPVEATPVAAQTPEAATSDDPDKDFNDIVEHSLDEAPPGPAQFFEQAPGEPPSNAGSGEALPPVPPTVEGGEWEQGDGEPWQQPAGGLNRSRLVDAISAVEAKHELDDLYHTSRENGLAAAVGFLGLGLVLEHIVAKRRDKKLKKQITAQGRQLKKTNQAVQRQHYTLQAAQRKLARLHTAQTTTAEQIRVSAEQNVHGAEVAAAAAGVIAGTAERGTTKMTPAQERVLADRLEHSRELGVAISRNPELQKEVQKGSLVHERQHTLERSFETANTTIQNQEQQITNLQHEVNYERLQTKYADSGGAGRKGSHGAGVDASGMPMLPTPHDQLPSGMESEHLLEAHGTPDKRPTANLVKPIAVATVLVILAAVIVMVYIR